MNTREVYQAYLVDESNFTVNIDNETIAGNRFDFTLYPNPADDEVYLVLGNNLPEKSYVQVFNSSGTLVQNKLIVTENNTYKLDLNNLTGLHYVRIVSEGQVLASKKLIIL